MEQRDGVKEGARPIVSRGVNLDAQVDFGRSAYGEVIILTPFNHPVRLGTRVRAANLLEPKLHHSVVRAQRWSQMLASGEVESQEALANRFGLTPGAVSRILKLVNLLPEIQAYLSALRGKQAIRHFAIKEVGPLAALPAELQRTEFQKLQQKFTIKVA